jgi:hypothetical protein
LLEALGFLETEIHACQKQNEVNNGAYSTDFWRLDNARAHERNRNIRKIEIELHPATYKECPCQEFAKLSTSRSKVECRYPEHGYRCYQDWSHIFLSLQINGFRIFSTPYHRRPSNILLVSTIFCPQSFRLFRLSLAYVLTTSS